MKKRRLEMWGADAWLERAGDGAVMPQARVVSGHGDYYHLVCEDAEGEVIARKKKSAFLGDDVVKPMTGDFVRMRYNPDGESMITEVLPRFSWFVRRDPTARRKEQTLAVNFDTLFVMMSAVENFSVPRLERFLALAEDLGDANIVVVLTKIDLIEGFSLAKFLAENGLTGEEAEFIAISSRSGAGLDDVRRHVREGRTVAFIGLSGVGKSSLVNALAGEEWMATQEVQEWSGKGRHTTTSRELVMLPSGAIVMDTPGIREIARAGELDVEHVKGAFSHRWRMKSVVAMAFAAACSLGSAQEEVDRAVVAPGGVRIEAQRVYVTAAKDETRGEGDWRDSEMAYSHGNATLRFRLENTNETAQTIHAQFPLETGDGSLLGWGRTITLAAGKEVGGGETVEWDVPVPMVGSISFGPSADPAQQPRIADSSGESAGTSMLRCFGYNVYEIILKNLYSPSGRVVADDAVRGDRPVVRLAVSPAARRFDFAEAYARVAKARSAVANSQDGERMVLEAPDFTRFRRWQDMSVYDMIAIDEDDWAHYPNNLKKLFPDWVAGGGTLAFIGTDESPIAPGNYGLGKVVALGASSPDLDALFKTLATTMIRYSLATSPFDCDIKASDAVGALRNETPFSTILLVLLAFSVLAGPVLVVTLARHNKRLVLFWLFPALAVAFSLGVMGVIICSHGIDPELRQFVHTIYDEKAGKVVTICNHVIIAPFTLQGDIRLDAQDSVVSYMSGDVRRCGETILYTGREFVFRDGWAPTLWPVVFRTVTVRDLSDAKDAPPVPLPGRLQEHYVSATEERRAAK